MANSREAQFKHDTSEGITGRGFKLAHGLTMVSDARSGKPLDPEKRRLAEVSDDDKLHFTNGIADLIERDEAVMAQVRSHSEDQVVHGLFPKKVTDAVLCALSGYGEAQHAVDRR
ncbi:hypothetical protein ACM25P_14675 [Vreelandella alkaliphila]|uniref:hypothetical protein n=1 Tax=Vreelandella alkaliphila TaxID=272774 RepID=UPI0039F6258C